MVCFTIVGATQTGKTTFLKENILKKYKNVLVYDVQNQYDFLPFFDMKKPIAGKLRVSPTQMSFEVFIKLSHLIGGFLFVCEESTQFLEGKISKDLKKSLVGKAHTKNRFVFIFHSFAQCPPRILDYTDYLIQFRTGISDVLEKVDLAVQNAKIELDTAPIYSRKIHKISNLAMEGKY